MKIIKYIASVLLLGLSLLHANNPPVVESTAVTTGVKDTLYSYELDTSDLDADANLTWSVTPGTTLPSWLTLTNSAPGVSTLAKTVDPAFKTPYGIAGDSSGNLYVSDTGNHLIRKIAPNGDVTTVAGTVGVSGEANGNGTSASFNSPKGITIDSNGNLYIADTRNHLIRKIAPNGDVTTVADSSSLKSPYDIVVDGSGNLYVTDTRNDLIKKIATNGDVTTVADEIARGITLDSSGNLYVADDSLNLIRKISSNGDVTTVAGVAGESGSDNGNGASATFKAPYGITIDSNDNLYIADAGNHMIRKIGTDGVVTTLAGTGRTGNVDGDTNTATFKYPSDLTVDANGNLYVADTVKQY